MKGVREAKGVRTICDELAGLDTQAAKLDGEPGVIFAGLGHCWGQAGGRGAER